VISLAKDPKDNYNFFHYSVKRNDNILLKGPMVKPNDPANKLKLIYEEGGKDTGKGNLLVSLTRLFGFLAADKEFVEMYPEFTSLWSGLTGDLDQGDPEKVEDGLTRIYCYLHGKDSAYTQEDRKEFDQYGGYWCHAGGLSPLHRAGPYITPSTRLADYGAGNGLQGLLFQYLYPHKKTCQIELSSKMIENGKRLQAMMKVPAERVEWIHKNVVEVRPCDFDFIYIYRPVRPQGVGRTFYKDFARELDDVSHAVTIFSIADCLKDFLSSKFKVFHDDGHLTCFTNQTK
jgi:hypothetical protein